MVQVDPGRTERREEIENMHDEGMGNDDHEDEDEERPEDELALLECIIRILELVVGKGKRVDSKGIEVRVVRIDKDVHMFAQAAALTR